MAARSESQQRPGSLAFTFVNHTGSSVLEKQDEEDLAIIKSHAMREVHRKRGIAKTASKPRAGSQIAVRYAANTGVVRRSGLLTSPMRTNWESIALCQFFKDFVYPAGWDNVEANSFRYLDFLPKLYERYANDSYLTEAVAAVALARFANQSRVDGLALRARQLYAKSLTLVNIAMFNKAEMASDRVLATLCLLTKYEIVSGDETGLWKLHEQGQAALIRHRGDKQLSTEVGMSLFRLIYIRQQMNCIAQSQQPPEQPQFNVELVFPSSYMRRLWRLMPRIALVRYKAQELFTTSAEDIPALRRLAQDAQMIDAEMLSFRKWLSTELKYSTISAADILPKADRRTSSYFPESIYLFEDLHHASTWAVFWFGQIFLLHSLFQYASLPFHHSKFRDASTQYLRLRLLQLVDDICASAPFVLGEIDDKRFLSTSKSGKAVGAHYSIWIMAAALSVPDVPEPQKRWIQERLQQIGFVQGIKAALVYA